MQTVVIIGGSGFLGSKVLEELASQGYNIVAIENKSSIVSNSSIKVIKGGIKALTSSLIREINPVAIFHCGRPTFSRFKKLGRRIASQKAALLNRNLLTQIEKSGTNSTLIFASGSLAYGNGNEAHMEDSPISPLSYSKQYIVGEMPILKSIGKSKFPVMVLRFPWLIGNGSWFGWFYHQNALTHGKIPQFGSGDNLMSLISVSDAASLMVAYSKQNQGSNVYNIFSPHIISQKDFLGIISNKYDCEIVDYKELYPGGLEKAAIEAFESNIIMGSNFRKILDSYTFMTIPESINHF